MRPIATISPLDCPDAEVALAAAGQPRESGGGATGSADGPARSGTRCGTLGRSDPNLAPRCGARTRAGLACRAPAMPNGRCRIHGGTSTGPRTPEGLARLAAARTRHGDYSAASRAEFRYRWIVLVRCRVFDASYLLAPYLPPDIAARVALGGIEMMPPPRPCPEAVAMIADKTLWSGARAGERWSWRHCPHPRRFAPRPLPQGRAR
jgi:hypothetical protein